MTSIQFPELRPARFILSAPAVESRPVGFTRGAERGRMHLRLCPVPQFQQYGMGKRANCLMSWPASAMRQANNSRRAAE